MSFMWNMENVQLLFPSTLLTFLGTFRYEGKLWVAKNAKQPVPLLILICEGARAFPQTDIVLLDERRHD